MAGAGYKLFNTGDVLTAAQVNTYLMQQTVMVFASATARTTALSGVLAEGMISYLQDTNATEVYDGSAWVGIANSGDITGVTAGTGISGGGTSGTVTITNSMATEITAAGDIIVGTGSGTFDNLPIGTTGQVLTADTTVSPYKVKWAAAAGGGKVLQVVSATYGTEAATTSSSYQDTGLSASITPSSTSSKILCIISQAASADQTSSATTTVIGSLQLLRGTTSVWASNYAYGRVGSSVSQNYFHGLWSIVYLDSPSTTSATTYKTQHKKGSAERSIAQWQSASTSSMVLLEIGA